MMNCLVFTFGVSVYDYTPICSQSNMARMSLRSFVHQALGSEVGLPLPGGIGQKLEQKMKAMQGTRSVCSQDMWEVLGGQKWDAGNSLGGKGRARERLCPGHQEKKMGV